MNTKILTVGDLRDFLSQKEMSPEAFAMLVHVSNMTIRRLLRKPSHSKLSSKYVALIESGLLSVDKSNDDPLKIVRTGMSQNDDGILKFIESDGEKIADPVVLIRDTRSKVRMIADSKILKSVSTLLNFLKGPLSPQGRALAIGALLYFLNPMDLIADAVVGIGFIDDLGIMTLVLSQLGKIKK